MIDIVNSQVFGMSESHFSWFIWGILGSIPDLQFTLAYLFLILLNSNQLQSVLQWNCFIFSSAVQSLYTACPVLQLSGIGRGF